MSNDIKFQEAPEPLSAIHKKSFAYTTIKDRLPVTITKVIDCISRFRSHLIERFGQDASEDCKTVLECLSELKYELKTDKPFKRLERESADSKLWNDQLETIGEQNSTWFRSTWLFAECYMYRRIFEAMLSCKTQMKYYDPFEQAKLETCQLGRSSVSSLIRALRPLENFTEPNLIHKNFHSIIQALLWSNKNDLSLSSGNDVSSKCKNLVDLLESMESFILCNHSENLWSFLNELKLNKFNQTVDKKIIRIDIVLDNCGIELASDLILCDFLLSNEYVDIIHLHAKAFPWFISDVVASDFDHLLKQLQADNSLLVNKFQSRLNAYRKENRLVLEHEHTFWTLGYSYDQMETIAPELYLSFKKNSSLVILKGDLNYRKLIGDLNWPFETSLFVAVRGFKPTSLCALRTLKADLVVELDTNEETNTNFRMLKQVYTGDNNKWLTNGEYGVIQFLKI